MLLDFPDIAGHEKETLFIIGNGFDKFHKLDTSYSDFHKWLKKEHQDFIDVIEAIFNEKSREKFFDEERTVSTLWTDFEAALGMINADTALDFLKDKYGDIINDGNALAQATEKIKSTVADVKTLMKEWAESIDISHANRYFHLYNTSTYITFNYTLTLEKCYNIDSKQILHIHGNVEDDNIVVGCERDVYRTPGEGTQYQRRYTKNINNEINLLNKPVDDLIVKHDKFFNSLASVTRVVVIGHSLSKIDQPYLKEIVEKIKINNPQCHWHFSAFSDKDHQKAAQFINSHLGGLENIVNNNHYIFNIRLISGSENTTSEN